MSREDVLRSALLSGNEPSVDCKAEETRDSGGASSCGGQSSSRTSISVGVSIGSTAQALGEGLTSEPPRRLAISANRRESDEKSHQLP